MSLFRRVGLLVAAALISSLLVALPGGPAHADYDLGVTWPEATVINTNVTDYTITITDSGPGDLYTRWNGSGFFEPVPIPHVGTVTVDLPLSLAGRVEIWRCVDGDCVWTGVSSPLLTLRYYVPVMFDLTANKATSPGTLQGNLYLNPEVDVTDATYDWVIRDLASSDVASGSGDLVAGENSITLDVPGGLSEGSYSVTATAHGSFAGGPLAASQETIGVTIDNTPPSLAVKPAGQVFFPRVDGYRDRLSVAMTASEDVNYDIELLDESNGSLGPPSVGTEGEPTSMTFSWDGTTSSAAVPAGTYRFRVTATDAVGHATTVVSSPVRVDLARKKTVHMTTELPASKVIYSRYVGKCSTLAKPSSHRWKNSLGLYSQTKCKSEKNNASVVVVSSAWWLPAEALHGVSSVSSLSLDVYAGPAKTRPGSYLVVGLIDNKDRFASREVLTKGVRWHDLGGRGTAVGLRRWVRYQDGRPYVVWSSGLTAGSRYDIKSFRMESTFEALVEPDGTVIAPPARRRTATPTISSPDTGMIEPGLCARLWSSGDARPS